MRRTVRLALLLIVLAGCDEPAPEEQGDAAVWLSTDGATWARVFDSALGGSGEQQMTGLTRFGERLVAVGFERLDGKVEGRVWLSGDGHTWTVVAPPAMSGPGDIHLWDVSDSPAGLLVVGTVTTDDELDGAVWLSTDGTDWVHSPDPNLKGAGPQRLTAVATYDSRIFVGGANADQPAIWASEDGLTWSAPQTLGTPVEEGWVAAVAVSEIGLVAVGAHGSDAGVWRSSDGETWTMVDDPAGLGGDGEQHMTGIVGGELGLVAVGGSDEYERIFFLGRGAEFRTEAAVWVSTDGLEWIRVADPTALSGVGDRVMYDVTLWGSTIVAVGVEAADPREEGLAGTDFDSGLNFDAAVWTSSDGQTWTMVRSQALGGPDWQDIFAVVAFDDTLVAVGGDDYGG